MTPRRPLLPACLLLFAMLGVPAVARADDAPTVTQRIVRGDLAGARAQIVTLVAEELSDGDRAAYIELLRVVDRWSAQGAPPRETSGSVVPPADADWEVRFAAARETLIQGSYADARVQLNALADTAPSHPAATRAATLGILADNLARESRAPASGARDRISEQPAAVETEEHWYGWQTLICDGASAVTVPLAGVGVAGYVLCAPIVHWAHGRVLAGFGSMGMRVVAPIALGMGLASVDCAGDSGSLCGIGGLLVGGILGIAGSIAIDAAVIARETRPKVKVVPTANAAASGFMVGIGGTF